MALSDTGMALLSDSGMALLSDTGMVLLSHPGMALLSDTDRLLSLPNKAFGQKIPGA